MKPLLTLAIAAFAMPLFAQSDLPAEFDDGPVRASCCDDCADRIGSLERRMRQIERDQISEDRVREICRQEIRVALRIRASDGTVRKTVSRPITQSSSRIVLQPGERLIAINGVPVSSVAPTSSSRVIRYSTPAYAVNVQSSGQGIIQRRTPVRNFIFGNGGGC